MAPIDDELRTALGRRADLVSPAADPLEGIERRARGIRRRRGLAAVLGTTAAVAAIALAVPAVIGSTTATRAPVATTTGPTGGLSYALDPAAPWAFRGQALPASVRDDFQSAWEEVHPGSRITPLFAQVYEPSAQPEALVLGRGDGVDRLGFLQAGAGGPTVVWEDAVAQLRPTSLAIALPGDEVGRLLVVAAPEVARIEYAADGATFVEMAALADGVATGPHTGQDGARYRVVAADGTLVDDTGAPDTPQPDNAVSWPLRGDLADAPSLSDAKEAFALGLGGSVDDVVFRPLLALSTDGGLRYVAGQAWLTGGEAHAVAYATGGECGADPFIGAVTPAAATVLAFAPGCVPGRTTDTVFVVPAPTTGQVLYGAQQSEYRPVSFLPGLEPVAELDRAPDDSRGTDRLRVLDGNGRVAFEGTLDTLLCGIRECG